MSADTPVDLASLSKSLTAMAVMELDRRDRLDLDAPVTRYVPELGAAFSRIKLHHLIRHRSGDVIQWLARTVTTAFFGPFRTCPVDQNPPHGARGRRKEVSPVTI